MFTLIKEPGTPVCRRKRRFPGCGAAEWPDIEGKTRDLLRLSVLFVEEIMKLSPGDKAPDFTLTDQNGVPVSLSDFRGHRVLVYFYPRANTSG